jgi:nicotinate-nucleotide pyrophosphorylase (carboxylating)
MKYLHAFTRKLIEIALAEDIGTGDITTRSIVPAGRQIKGHFIAKEDGVICGMGLMQYIFAYIDQSVQLNEQKNDGDHVKKGEVIAYIEGPAQAILTGERVALNFLQHLSGIATQTAFYVNSVKGTGLHITDTRKTTPGMRVLEKYAVRMGGGYNHRMNLSDGVLIKDNHIKAAGGIIPAIIAARENAPMTLKIEVETESLEQVREALEAGADIIMLDNMDYATMKAAVDIIKGRALTEASGNMDQKNLLEVAATGVDMVSIGALTHSVKAMDISLRFID